MRKLASRCASSGPVANKHYRASQSSISLKKLIYEYEPLDGWLYIKA